MKRQRQKAIAALCIFIFFIVASSVQADPVVTVANFSRADTGSALPKHWEAMTFEKILAHTTYETIMDPGLGQTVIKAQSRASASGLIRKVRIDLKKYPIIQWQWKITSVYKNGDVTQKTGDDYPARLYVTFEYDPDKVGFWDKAKF